MGTKENVAAPAARSSEDPGRGTRRAAVPPRWRPGEVAAALGAGARRAAPHAPLVLVCWSLIALGVALRIQDIAFPDRLIFDEHHFVNNARNYLQGEADNNDHPPLGKLLIALGMLAWGDGSLGWRMVPLLLGLGNVLLAYGVCRAAFRSSLAGWLGAAFIAGDGFLIVYSRGAMIDGFITHFGLACGWALIGWRAPWRLFAAAVLVGLAASVKFSGGGLLLAVVVATFSQRGWLRRLGLLLATGATAAGVYCGIYSFGLALSERPSNLHAVYSESVRLLAAHGSSTSFEHPLACRWYTWFVPTRTITIHRLDQGDLGVRMMTSLGNPLLWWASAAVSLGVVGAMLWLGPRELTARLRRSRAGLPLGWLGKRFEGHAMLAVLWLSMMLPWILYPRDSYLYHYLPSYAFGLLLLAGGVTWVYERRAWLGMLVVLAAAEVTVFYAPVWVQYPLTQSAVRQRLFLPGWR
jgi:dolichyl-phosphate-mannose--protein O-mannosyl transferase